MDEGQFSRLVEVMAAIAGGDRAAITALYLEFGGQIAALVRRELATFSVSATAEDVDGLVIDSCLELGSIATAWRPEGGALPWNWARLRLRHLVSNFVGNFADPFDPARHDVASDRGGDSVQAVSRDRDDLEGLTALAADGHSIAALLTEAFGLCGIGIRNQTIVVAYQLQSDQGDPSPANTIAAEHRMGTEAVRQVVSRTRRKLRDLAGSEPRFAPLAAIPLVA